MTKRSKRAATADDNTGLATGTAIAPISLNFESMSVRVVMIDGEPWFVLVDVCRALNLSNPRRIAQRIDDDEKGVTLSYTLGGAQEMTIVSEQGLYTVVLRSNAAITPGTFAYRFRRWLTHDVVPSIRKFGMYPPPPAALLDAECADQQRAKTLGERFQEERLRWEAETGFKLAEIPCFSAPIIRAIERTGGGVTKGQRLQMLIFAGLDVLYILNGNRLVSPKERRVLDYLRQAGDPRQMLPFGDTDVL